MTNEHTPLPCVTLDFTKSNKQVKRTFETAQVIIDRNELSILIEEFVRNRYGAAISDHTVSFMVTENETIHVTIERML